MDIVCNNGSDANNLENYKKRDSFELTSDGILKQEKIVFLQNTHYMDNSEPVIVFVGQTSLGQTLSIKRFVVEYIGDQKLKASEKELGTDLKALQNFRPNLTLIAIVYQWIESLNSYNHIIFFKDNWIIRWCLTDEKKLNIEEV